MSDFTHLHVHTQYSLLDGAADIPGLVYKAKELGMKALAITDHGSLFGVKEFHEYATKNGIKPLLGCETYVALGSRHNKTDKDAKTRHHMILLAKNKQGYHNLTKLISKAWTEGFYYKPRIDKDLLYEHREGLIITSACLGGEIPQFIMKGDLSSAEKSVMEYKDIFGDDFYLEMQRHFTGDPEKDGRVFNHQKMVNDELLRISKKTGVKLVASNDVHFLRSEDAQAHDILVCLNTGKDYDDPNRLKYTGEEYLKSPAQMAKLFGDMPEAIDNLTQLVEKIEHYKLDRPILLPNFPMPDRFGNQDDYLRYLTYIGAEKKYEEINAEVKERLDYELTVIKNMGFAGYFLIVQDFIAAAREMGVAVGPGRGSAAGSAVAFCVGITNVDPIKYNLLFERFLNPERVSMPDVDIDFDEDGRDAVLKWVVNKYGKDRVAQIITFGTMAARSSIKDVARVLKLPLSESNRLAKLVPEKAGTTLKQAFDEVSELKAEKNSVNELIKKTLKYAETLEGSVRHTGVHACGVIIGPENLIEHIPLTVSKDADLLVTQFEGKYVESVGMLKMDFLGLKTLSIIKDAVENVKISKGISIDVDKIPMDDLKTFELYQKGETVGTFQFESSGMRMYLKDLKPSNIEDLFAMNALYRPGPMDFIPSYIKRKHGQEKVEYPHPMLEKLLKDTYGIMIYQEQIMQAAQIMASYSLGAADILRRAMGKKKPEEMAKQKSVFVDGAIKNGVEPTNAAEVFSIMEGFAAYGFNRSHSAAYSLVAFQTGYLKANYPAEYMSAVLSRNLNDIKKITIFMDECKRMGLKVLGPDINESHLNFTVNKKGEIRFGMAAIKGVGEGIVQDIISCRSKDGAYVSIHDFLERVNLNSLNKRVMESLALAGALDGFNIKRSQFFAPYENEPNYLEALLKYAGKMQNDGQSSMMNLFVGDQKATIKKPEPPMCEDWGQLEKLNKEKELIGIYLSAHPLDDFRFEVLHACNKTMADLEDLPSIKGIEIKVAGIVTMVNHKIGKNNKPYGDFSLEDYSGAFNFRLFGEDYLKFKNHMTLGYTLFIKGKANARYDDANQLEFKILSVEFLSDIKDKMSKTLAIKISIDQLNDQLINDIQELTDENKGNAVLKFLIFDPETKMWIQMLSRSHKVNISNSLIDYLESNPLLDYKIFTN